MKNRKMRRVVTAVLCFLIGVSAYAGNEKVVLNKTSSELIVGSQFTLKDDKYDYMVTHPTGVGAPNPWNQKFTNKSLYNRITLSVDPYYRTIVNKFSLTVEFQVSYEEWDFANNSFHTVQVSPNPILTLEYDPSADKEITDIALYRFVGGNKMKVTLLSVVLNPSANTIPANVNLELQVEAERYYNFNRLLYPIQVNSTLDGSRNELEVYWEHLEGTEEYEVEWTHVNDYETNGTQMNASSIPFVKTENPFKLNSTRISTTQNFYRIPILYERGYILYRIRAVGRSPQDNFTKNLYSNWSDFPYAYSSVGNFPNKVNIQEHNKMLNWQSSVSFAEEGKNKVSTSYFDGSLRNRQVVTKMNTQDNVIVGETVYDHQGRPAVQILPSPINSSKIEYKPGLNNSANANSRHYDKTDFDLDNSSCTPTANPLDSLTDGASRYYSNNNPNKDLNENQFIPTAQGYPFTQTQYMPDNTGRIKKQSGVGSAHQLGTGHETRYIYSGPPDQGELDKLFGSEVGNSIRYKKNLVVDANGQVSISFLDAQGRVIATALAGDAPENLTELSSAPSNALHTTTDLLGKEEGKSPYEIEDDATRTFTRDKALSSSSAVKFNYTITNKTFSEQCQDLKLGDLIAGNVTNCYDCVIDLEITLTDECGNSYLLLSENTNPKSTKTVVGQTTLNAIQNAQQTDPLIACQPSPESLNKTNWTTTTLDGTPVATLPVGNYNITKVVTVNQEALDYYTEKYLNSNECLMTFEQVYENKLSDALQGGCNTTCAECLTKLGEYSQYDVAVNSTCNPCLTSEQYFDKFSECKEICNTEAIDCKAMKSKMLADMSPAGQYANYYHSHNKHTIWNYPSEFPLSILLPDQQKDISFPLSNNPVYGAFPMKKAYVGAGENNSDLLPNWRFPYNPNETHPVKKYRYLDEDHKIAKVAIQRVYKDNNGSGTFEYSPEVLKEELVESELVDNEKKYFTIPQNLKNVVDFKRVFNLKSWSKSLIYYHPEYCYYQYCQQNSESNTFDDLWLNTDEVSKAPVGYEHPLGASPAQSIDPFFNPSQNPLFDIKDYNFMKNKIQNYVSSNGWSMHQLAYVLVNCPASNSAGSACSNATNCLPSNLPPMNDKVWVNFRSFYYSAKRALVERKATKYAIEHGCYNGCIGNENFSPAQDNFIGSINTSSNSTNPFLPTYALLYERDVLQNNFFSAAQLKILAYTSPSQFYNFQQTCNNFNYKFYDGKTKLYLRNAEGINKGENKNKENCSQLIASDPENPVDLTEYPDICSMTEEDGLEEQNAAAFAYYEQCGECPQVKYFETFLSGLASQSATINLFTAQNFVLNCVPDGMPEFIPALETEMGFSTNTGGLVKWNTTTTNANNNTLNADITKENQSNICHVTLFKLPSYSFKDPNTGLPVTPTIAWSDINQICCIRSINAIDPSYSTPPVGIGPGRLFAASAFVDVTYPDNSKRSEKIEIQGYTTTLYLKNCTAPRVCSKLKVASDLQALWNGLMYSAPQVTMDNGEVIPPVLSHFAAPQTIIDDNVLVNSSTNAPYEHLVSATLSASLLSSVPSNQNATNWRWLVTSNTPLQLKASLKIVNGITFTAVSEFYFEFNTTTSIDFSKVVAFSNIRPNTAVGKDPEHDFLILAKVIDGNTITYVPITGYSAVTLATCANAVFPKPTNPNESVDVILNKTGQY